jgi:hypothetical protein
MTIIHHNPANIIVAQISVLSIFFILLMAIRIKEGHTDSR